MSSIHVYGNYTHDLITWDAWPNRKVESIGGAPIYVASILNALNVQHHIVARVGHDFKYHSLLTQTPLRSETTKTTAFHNHYTDAGREQYVTSLCEPLVPTDIIGASKIRLVCGVAGEVLPETVQALGEKSGKVLCDLQSFLRIISKTGQVTEQLLENSAWAQSPQRIDYIKMNDHESQYVNIDSLRQECVVIVTRGSLGATWYEKELEITVSAPDVKEIDPTGAGDCFMAGFAWALEQGCGPQKCLEIANCCGAISVRQLGVPKVNESDLSQLNRLMER